jgi:hypothetical protein
MATRVQKSSRLTSLVIKLRAELERLRSERIAHLDETASCSSQLALPPKSARGTRSERAWALERRRKVRHLHVQAATVEGQLMGELDALAAVNSEVANLRSRIDAIESTTAKLSRDRRTHSLDRDDERQQDRLTGRRVRD